MTVRIVCLAPRPMARWRLVLVPYAGAGVTAFRSWAALVPGDIEPFALQLPGREDRLSEPAMRNWPAMMLEVIAAFRALPSMPTCLYGYSLGAVIALELARSMESSSTAGPEHLFCAARPWPGISTGERIDLNLLTDDELLTVLDRQYGSLSSSLTHPAIREVFLPCLRADLALLASHRWRPAPPLKCPLTIHGGNGDPMIRPETLESWRVETAAAFRTRIFDGDHFFLNNHRAAIIEDIASSLAGTAS